MNMSSGRCVESKSKQQEYAATASQRNIVGTSNFQNQQQPAVTSAAILITHQPIAGVGGEWLPRRFRGILLPSSLNLEAGYLLNHGFMSLGSHLFSRVRVLV